ncbi:MAG TPA: flagellar hook-basal body complex protein FliE [Permianibacter sp.]|nr:flagellar hook-basal body complex protein FliE [Permianibacter sp.]
MNTIDRSQLLSELRALAGQAGAGARADTVRLDNKLGGLPTSATPGVNGVQQFGNLFSQALDNVSSLQQQSSALQTRVELGDKSVSLVQAMVASQKSSIAFQATVQVRNRLVAAYQDIMNMPI